MTREYEIAEARMVLNMIDAVSHKALRLHTRKDAANVAGMLGAIRAAVKGASIGAFDMFGSDDMWCEGPMPVRESMLQALGATMAIIGESERTGGESPNWGGQSAYVALATMSDIVSKVIHDRMDANRAARAARDSLAELSDKL